MTKKAAKLRLGRCILEAAQYVGFAHRGEGKESRENQGYPGVHGMQAAQLPDEQEQADHAGPPGVQKVLQVLPPSYRSQGNEIGLLRKGS